MVSERPLVVNLRQPMIPVRVPHMRPMRPIHLALLIAIVPAQQSMLVNVRTEPPTNVSCRMRSSDDSEVTLTGPLLAVSCPEPTKTISCDGPDVEPIDSPVEALCRRSVLQLTPGVPVQVAEPDQRPFQVEWLSIDGEREVVQARRGFDKPTEAALVYARTTSRFLRFRRIGGSPFTVQADLLGNDKGIVLPRVKEGGEVLVALPALAVIKPIAIRLQGSVPATVSVRDPITIVTGVPAGRYSLFAIYRGGIERSIGSHLVRNGQSSWFRASTSEVAGLRVKGSPTLCSAANEVVVQAATSAAVTRPTGRTSAPAAGRCEWEFDGFVPGDYQVSLRGPLGVIASSTVSLVNGVTVATDIATPQHHAVGVLSQNGRPLPDAVLTLGRLGDSAGVTGTTDRNGRFRIPLPGAGFYNVRIQTSGGRILPQSRLLEVRDQTTDLNWDVVGGTITVVVNGAAKQRPVRVMFRSDILSMTSTLAPGLTVVQREAVPFGQYEVFAIQDGQAPLVSALTIRTVTSASEVEPVTLDLVGNSSVARVRDANGAPISGVRIGEVARVSGTRRLTDQQWTSQETAPGDYPLAGFPPATDVQIRIPGHAPACKKVPESGIVFVKSEVGRRVVLEFNSPLLKQLNDSLGAIEGVEGSDCAVTLSNLQVLGGPTNDETVSSFVVEHFPSGKGLVWLLRFPTMGRQVLDPRAERIRLVLPSR